MRLGLSTVAGSAALTAGSAGYDGGAPTAPERAEGRPVTIGDLRCEYLTDPIGIDELTPRLTWITEAKSRGWRQSAYQIVVASKEQLLAPGAADLWDSGQVHSGESVLIPYAGKPLRTREECVWKVRVWDDKGHPSSWSRSARWEIGLLDEQDWRGASWIGRSESATSKSAPEQTGSKDRPTLPHADPAPFLRREFKVKSRVRRARIYACGLGYAELHLNGGKVAHGVERDPGYTGFDKRVLYVTHDVTSQLRPGENAIGAILGTGWFDVHDLATWNFDRAPWRARPRLRLALFIDYADGTAETVLSDDSWKAADGPIVRDGIYTGEVYDARLELPGWAGAAYDEGRWRPVSVLSAPAGKLSARCCPPVAVSTTIAPKSVREVRPGVFIVDMGQNFSGHALLRVRGAAAGTAITMRYGEKIDAAGMLDVSNIDIFMTKTEPRQAFQQDTYICKGGAEEEWEQRFSYSGFRYVEVTGFPGKPTAANFSGRFAHTALESAGEFTCSDETVNRIQSATRWAYLSNAQSIPTDCPQREKNGWTGDAQLAAEAGLMNFRSASFYAKWLDDLADVQLPDGRLSPIVPNGGWSNGQCNPAWDSAYAIVAWELYRYCGDQRALERHYAGIRRYTEYLAGRLEHGTLPFESLGDWVPWSTKTPSQFTSTLYLYVNARTLELAARLSGKRDDERNYAALAAKVRDGLNAKYFDAARNSYANGSQTALAMALYFGLVPEGHGAKVLAALIANIESQGHIDTGILGAKYVLRVLAEAGRADLAFRLITRKEQPSWAWWIEQGATTLWEDWKGASSLNHIMFGDVSNWFFQWVAGIGLDPDSPGFAHIRIQPQPLAGLTWAKASYDSVRGRIVSHWERKAGAFSLDLTIPANTQATLYLPSADASSIKESGIAARSAKGVRFLREQAGCALFDIGCGHYRFESRLNTPPA